MTHTMLLWLFGFSALVPLVAVPLLMREIGRQERIAIRIWEVQRAIGQGGIIIKPVSGRSMLIGCIEALGGALTRSGMLSASTLNELEETLSQTRLRGTKGLSIFVGLKVLLFLGMPLIAVILGGQSDLSAGVIMSFAVTGAIIGLLAPDFVLRSVRKGYLKQVEIGLADALDMMVICAEAGLGLETAIERVSEEIAVAHKAVAQELTRTSQDLRMIADRKTALLNMGKRTGLDSMKRLASTLVQSAQLGTPLTKALRTISGELRQEALTRFEARAARLPVLLTVPMILFILPCVFVVVAGPAGLQAAQAMHHH